MALRTPITRRSLHQASGRGPPPTSYLTASMVGTTCVISEGYIYCIGGQNLGSGNHNFYSVFYAPISSSGIGSGESTTSYPSAVAFLGCATDGGYVYCVSSGVYGGVYYASVSPSGVGTWVSTTSYPGMIVNQVCSTSGAYIYCVGGPGSDRLPSYQRNLLCSHLLIWDRRMDADDQLPGKSGTSSLCGIR